MSGRTEGNHNLNSLSCDRDLNPEHLSNRTIKEKVKLSLCLTKHHAMKTYWENGGIVPHILDLGIRWR
jgi:hypothetical protein